MSGEQGLSIVASVVGALSAILTAALAFAERNRTRSAVANLQDVNLKETLADPDLDRLGRLLSEEIGRIEIADYTGDEQVQKRFKGIIAEALQYLEAPVGSQGEPQPPIATKDTRLQRDELSGPFEKAYDAIASGNVWNGLALIRRTLEIELRRRLDDSQRQEYRSASAMARQLWVAGVLGQRELDELLAAIRVCSSGIHGEDVGEERALEALRTVTRVLAHLDQGRKA